MSVHSISNLERGVAHQPRRETLSLLAQALLGLSPQERLAFVAAGLRHAGKPESLQATRFVALPPVPPTLLIGREQELQAICALRWRPEVRLLTLGGQPGVGKTRLALAVAAALAEVFTDGVVWVPLAPIRASDQVAPAIAQALGLREQRATLLDHIQSQLHDRHLLLLIDNFEQVLSAASLMADLLAYCPQVSILVTSRTPLRVRGEQEYPLAPLALPVLQPLPALEALLQTPAVALFVQRAQAVLPTFALTTTNASAVAALCKCLDGLPLALELAARHLKLLSPPLLLIHLEQHRLSLRGDVSDLPPPTSRPCAPPWPGVMICCHR